MLHSARCRWEQRLRAGHLLHRLQLRKALPHKIRLIRRVHRPPQDLRRNARGQLRGLLVDLPQRLFLGRPRSRPWRAAWPLRPLSATGIRMSVATRSPCAVASAIICRTLSSAVRSCVLYSRRVASALARAASASAMSLRMRSSRALRPASTLFHAVGYRITSSRTKMTSTQMAVFASKPMS